eukprot:TRINITY_DN46926_c0_g1_i1.p1 TRINITY_DN46926_c0_g1~~TRINITY_DN46926_c0_g1_i1.p1  ORF type:complete len:243 (-),score=23.57 TRINITY_DN46926_c0_g1_i1:4-732(-)
MSSGHTEGVPQNDGDTEAQTGVPLATTSSLTSAAPVSPLLGRSFSWGDSPTLGATPRRAPHGYPHCPRRRSVSFGGVSYHELAGQSPIPSPLPQAYSSSAVSCSSCSSAAVPTVAGISGSSSSWSLAASSEATTAASRQASAGMSDASSFSALSTVSNAGANERAWRSESDADVSSAARVETDADELASLQAAIMRYERLQVRSRSLVPRLEKDVDCKFEGSSLWQKRQRQYDLRKMSSDPD